MIDFTGKVLLLTGANGGIARAIAKLYHRLGGQLVLTDIEVAGLEAFARELGGDPARVVTLRHDARDAQAAQAAVAAAQERYGGIDHVVTGAGLYRESLVSEMSDAQWRELIGVNLDGVFYTCRAAVPALRDGGAIATVASIAGHRGSYEHAHYAAAKGGVLAFTRSLAMELAPRVRVNAVSPGFIETPFIKDFPASRVESVVATTPLKRLGSPEEVARAVVFLCSDWASFITGEAVHVNGGLYISG